MGVRSSQYTARGLSTRTSHMGWEVHVHVALPSLGGISEFTEIIRTITELVHGETTSNVLAGRNGSAERSEPLEERFCLAECILQ